MDEFTVILDCIQALLIEEKIISILENIEYNGTTRKLYVINLLEHRIASYLDG